MGSKPLNMERVLKDWMGLLSIAILYLSTGTSFFTHCDARGPSEQSTPKYSMKVKIVNHLDSHSTLDKPYNYVASPFTLPSYDDVMGSQVNPIYCIYPPPQPPTTTSPPSLTTNYPSPPPPSPPSSYSSPTTPNPSPPQYSPPPPKTGPSPPTYEPSPPGPITNPPIIVNPSPHQYVPSPPLFVPGPPIFQPPVVYPPPFGSPPPSPSGTSYSLWCVAKPSVPDPIIQEAMDYACGSGADCDSIQPSGSCYEPDTLIAHASFAFNSYWQRTRVAGGTCDFGGTAMLVTRDPSFDGCHFQRT